MSAPFVSPADDSTTPEFDSLGRRRAPQTAVDQNTIIPHGWRPTASEPVPVVRCTAIKSNGERCKQWSLRGATVCYAHGGRLRNVSEHAAAVVESARLRLIGIAHDAIDQIEDLMENAPQEAIRLKAAQDVLDRAGIRGGIELDVSVQHEVKAVDRVQDRLRQISDRLTPTPQIDESENDELILDAEVIEDVQ